MASLLNARKAKKLTTSTDMSERTDLSCSPTNSSGTAWTPYSTTRSPIVSSKDLDGGSPAQVNVSNKDLLLTPIPCS